MLLTILVNLLLMVVLMVQTEPRETELQFLHLTVLVKMVGLMMHPMRMMLKKTVVQLKKLELLRSKLLVMMGVPMVLVVLLILLMNMVMELDQMKML